MSSQLYIYMVHKAFYFESTQYNICHPKLPVYNENVSTRNNKVSKVDVLIAR